MKMKRFSLKYICSYEFKLLGDNIIIKGIKINCFDLICYKF